MVGGLRRNVPQYEHHKSKQDKLSVVTFCLMIVIVVIALVMYNRQDEMREKQNLIFDKQQTILDRMNNPNVE